jgi:RTC4-like domain
MHESATAASRQYPPSSGVPLRETRRNGIMAVRLTKTQSKREKSVDIDAEPLSSSDDEAHEKEAAEPTPKTKRILDGLQLEDKKILQRQRDLEESRGAAKPMRGKSAGNARRPRAKVADDPNEISLIHGQEEQDADNGKLLEEEDRMISWASQPAAKKRRTYHSSGAVSNIHTGAAGAMRETGFKSVPEKPSPSRSGRITRSGFQAPDELKSPPSVVPTRASFIVPTEHDLPDRRTRSKLKEQDQAFKLPDDILSPRSATANSAMFKLPPDSTTSSATTADQAPTVFSHPDSPPLVRSRSASSLSSVDSIASLLLTQDEKDELMKDDQTMEKNTTNPVLHTAVCPLCSTPVSAPLLEEFTFRYSKTKSRLTSRLQQQFCREHRAHAARETWHDRGYPAIDWDNLATTRITRHLPAVRAVLQNRTRSLYRDHLVTAMEAGKGRRNLLKYLKEGVLDVVRYGYYGPRGGKVAAEAITMRLSGELADAAKGDVVVREAGAGGFVQAVLVPEMVGRWVAEDRELRWEMDGKEVRRILEESAEMGLLVNEDEDSVVVSDDRRRDYAREHHDETYIIT